MSGCVDFVPRFLSAAAIVAIIARALRLIAHNLLKRLIWPVFSAYRSGCHNLTLFLMTMLPASLTLPLPVPQVRELCAGVSISLHNLGA